MITATVYWTGNQDDFLKGRYSRSHHWYFDGGIEVVASSSPHVVPLPLSNENAVDPEEAYVASLSSCHMLWFLSIASKAGFAIEEYRDEAIGKMEKDDRGKAYVSQVTLRPTIRWFGREPDTGQIGQMHHQAHDECFIANSVKTEIRIED
ncbi:MAG: OsmC family protein [Planctomycetota bacterium]